MTQRERYLQTLLFGSPDRVPLDPGGGRLCTRRAWLAQGLPETVAPADIPRFAFEQTGSPFPWPDAGARFPVDERMIPQFQETVLEVREHSQVVQDWKGNVCEIGREFTTEHLRDAIDFVTRRWIRCPVETHDDWEAMKERYNPDDPARLPEDAAQRGERLADRTWPVVLHFSGPFRQMREWLGFERLCTTFYDDPELIRDMVAFWTDCVARSLPRRSSVSARW